MASPNGAAKGIKTSHDDRFDNGVVKRTLGLPQNVLRTSRNPYAAELLWTQDRAPNVPRGAHLVSPEHFVRPK